MARKRKKRAQGRPEHKPTKESRRKVAIAAGGGMKHEEIAFALDLSRNTLEKHYAKELSIVAAEKRLEVMQALHVAAKKGRVAAIKEYLSVAPQVAPPPAQNGETAKAEKIGKKEQAERGAVEAAKGSEWESDLPRHGRTTH